MVLCYASHPVSDVMRTSRSSTSHRMSHVKRSQCAGVCESAVMLENISKATISSNGTRRHSPIWTKRAELTTWSADACRPVLVLLSSTTGVKHTSRVCDALTRKQRAFGSGMCSSNASPISASRWHSSAGLIRSISTMSREASSSAISDKDYIVF